MITALIIILISLIILTIVYAIEESRYTKRVREYFEEMSIEKNISNN